MNWMRKRGYIIIDSDTISEGKYLLSAYPMFEQTETPYQYTYQNSIKFIDPMGMWREKVPMIE